MIRFALTCLLALCSLLSTKAQQHRYGSWNTVGIDYKLNKKWHMKASETVRYYPSPAYETQWLMDIGLERELTKKLSITPSYRLTYRASNLTHRLYADLAYQERPGDFQFTNRLRYQYQWDRYDETSQYLRNKLTIKYRKPKKFTPLFAGELFYRLGYSYNFVDAFRLFVGTDYKINKKWSASLQLMREQEIQVSDPMTTDALQLGLDYEF